MLKIAVFNYKEAESLIFSLVKYNIEFNKSNRVTLFSLPEDFYLASEDGQEYDIIFVNLDSCIDCAVEIADFVRNELHNDITGIVFISSDKDAFDNIEMHPRNYLIGEVNYDKISEFIGFYTRQSLKALNLLSSSNV